VLRLADSPQWARRSCFSKGARLFTDNLSEADSLVIERGALRMALQRKGGRWLVTQPLATGADTATVLRFIDCLERAPRLDQLPLHDLRRRGLLHSDFGFTQPSARVVVRGALSRHEIIFGGQTPSGDGVYAVLANAGDMIIVTDLKVIESLPGSIEEWRDKSLLGDCEGKWTALEIRRPNAPFMKLVYENNVWRLIQPIVARASTKRVSELLELFQGARIEGFITPSGTADDSIAKADLMGYGFYELDADNAIQLQFWESGSPAGLRVRLGRTVEGNIGLVYALTPGDNSLVTVTNALAAAVPSGVGDIRSKRVFDGTTTAVRKVSMQYDNETITLLRSEGISGEEWQITAPVALAADGHNTRRFISSVMSLRTEMFIELDEEHYEVEPLCRIELELEGGEVQRAKLLQSPAMPTWYEFSHNGSATALAVSVSNMPPILINRSGVLELADRTVMSVAAQSLQRITVKGEERDELVERKAGTVGDQWVTATGSADVEVLQEWATALSELRATDVVQLGSKAQDLAAYGLDKPWLEVTVDVDSERTVRQTLLVGRKSAESGRYAAVRGHDVIYELAPEIVAMLQRPLTVQ